MDILEWVVLVSLLLSIGFAVLAVGVIFFGPWVRLYWYRYRLLSPRLTGTVTLPRRRSPFEDQSLHVFDFEDFLKKSEELKALIGTDSEARLYKKILGDPDLIRLLQQAKSKTEALEILTQWMHAHGEEISSVPSSSKTVTRPHRAYKRRTTSVQSSTHKEPASQKDPNQPQAHSLTEALLSETDSVRITYTHMVSLVEEKKFEELLEVIQRLSDEEIQLLSKRYAAVSINEPTVHVAERLFKHARSVHDIATSVKHEILHNLTEKYEELRRKISFLRKKGVNVNQEDLLVMSLPIKIKLFGATFRKEDFTRIKRLLSELEIELNSKQDLITNPK